MALAAANLGKPDTASPFLDFGVKASTADGGSCATGLGYEYVVPARTELALPPSGMRPAFRFFKAGQIA
jgi:hypothetical protein